FQETQKEQKTEDRDENKRLRGIQHDNNRRAGRSGDQSSIPQAPDKNELLAAFEVYHEANLAANKQTAKQIEFLAKALGSTQRRIQNDVNT
ncbi:MAG: hypothetical protein QOD03_1198, partial [Verrucomicrobiota bacterium]